MSNKRIQVWMNEELRNTKLSSSQVFDFATRLGFLPQIIDTPKHLKNILGGGGGEKIAYDVAFLIKGLINLFISVDEYHDYSRHLSYFYELYVIENLDISSIEVIVFYETISLFRFDFPAFYAKKEFCPLVKAFNELEKIKKGTI